MKTITYKSVGNCRIKLDVYPAFEPHGPLIVWIHGGALIGGSRTGIHPVLRELLAKQGFAQVSIDYRLAPETKLPQILEDVRDAFDWVRTEGAAHFAFDANRLGVIGHSAGGYLTLMTGFMIQPRPKTLVSYYGYGDIVGPWYSRPDPFYCRQPRVSHDEAWASVGTHQISETTSASRFRFYLYCRQNGLWPNEVVGLDPSADATAFDPFCPIRNVTDAYPPTLLLHGDADTDVPHQLSVDMAAALTIAGVEHRLITIPNGPHGFDNALTLDTIKSNTSPAGEALDETLVWFAQRL